MSGVFAGVELGGTKCVCILASGTADIKDRVMIRTGTPRVTLQAIKDVLSKWQATTGFDALGVASFGPLELSQNSSSYGHIISTPKPGWSGVDLTQLSVGVPVRIDTDVNGAALAEGLWGKAAGLDSWTYITVGTGIGVGTVISGRVARGLGHSEAGHLRIPASPDGWEGSCPYHGDCVEGQASGFAIEARTNLSGPDIPDNHPVWNNVAEALASLCHNLVYSTLPQKIIIGGSVPLNRPILMSLIRKKLQTSLGGYASAVKLSEGFDDLIAYPEWGESAGPLGAIALAKLISD